jgi:hypothetical protein
VEGGAGGRGRDEVAGRELPEVRIQPRVVPIQIWRTQSSLVLPPQCARCSVLRPLADPLRDKRPHENITIIQVFKGFSGHTRIYLLAYTSYVTAVLRRDRRFHSSLGSSPKKNTLRLCSLRYFGLGIRVLYTNLRRVWHFPPLHGHLLGISMSRTCVKYTRYSRAKDP